MRTGRRRLVPETVQTSTMDCGPACLKSLLEGFGIHVSYDRLREICQTDLDGTSINTIEDVAVKVGLNAEQIMVPLDHLLLPEASVFPAIIVVRLPNSFVHFVIGWGYHGGRLQIMDPATGRQWPKPKGFLDRVHVHMQAVPANSWREWASSEEFTGALRRRAQRLRVPDASFSVLLETALADENWRPMAALDAAIRMMTPVVEAGGLRGSQTTGRVLDQFFHRATSGNENAFYVIPPAYWSVLPARARSEGEQLVFSGAVLVRVRGRQPEADVVANDLSEAGGYVVRDLPQRLQPAAKPALTHLVQLLRADGLLRPITLAGALIVATSGVAFEALVFRTLLDLPGVLELPQQRLVALASLIAFLCTMLALDLFIVGGKLGCGRRLEIRLRTFLLEALPKLSDRYFGSRLISDMAERSHAIHEIRGLPSVGVRLIMAACQLILTTAGVIWLDPRTAPLAVTAAVIGVMLPFIAQPIFGERDLRFRTHAGGLCRFYFDALRGLVPIRTHRAGKSVEREHEGLLATWARAGLDLLRATVVFEVCEICIGFALIAGILLIHIQGTSDSAVGLLLVYWALNIPVLGQQLSKAARFYPRQLNLARRLLDPLTAREEDEQQVFGAGPRPATVSQAALSVVFEDVSVRAIGRTILETFSLEISPGTHICIIGPSGAGKSTLVSLLLGWHQPATGRILVDGLPLDRARLDWLRHQTAWVDPSIQIWNRSLLENLRYGLPPDAGLTSLPEIIEEADLVPVLEKLPEGMQTRLGEGGGLVSGGEGQRVRLGRAMLRRTPRLVILDEPFTALDRLQRRELMQCAKSRWRNATVLCITHDIEESRYFERVIVIEQGRIMEDGSPATLARRSDSRYRQMLESDRAIRAGVWSKDAWRTMRLDGGQISEMSEHNEHDERFASDLLARSAFGGSSGSFVPQNDAASQIK
ncbi:MAG: ATP-binding cassette domain-containing protein [Bryobacteraceae bacterium]